MRVRERERERDDASLLFPLINLQAPNYCGVENNSASVLRVSESLECSFVTLQPRFDLGHLSAERFAELARQAANAAVKSPLPGGGRSTTTPPPTVDTSTPTAATAVATNTSPKSSPTKIVQSTTLVTPPSPSTNTSIQPTQSSSVISMNRLDDSSLLSI